jgi:hypothetical protein
MMFFLQIHDNRFIKPEFWRLKIDFTSASPALDLNYRVIRSPFSQITRFGCQCRLSKQEQLFEREYMLQR